MKNLLDSLKKLIGSMVLTLMKEEMMHPKVATIVPLKHLNTIIDDEYFMCLSHAAENSEYLHFFEDRSKEGKYVILDNSAIEMGGPESFETYLEKALLMEASEIMLPDIFPDPVATLLEARRCMALLKRVKYSGNVMVIPQGATVLEWLSNARDLCEIRVLRYPMNPIGGDAAEHWEATTIGISYRHADLFGGNRIDILWLLDSILPGFQKIHFLGVKMDPRFEARLAIKQYGVRGVDSSFPCVYTRHGIKITPEFLSGSRPTREIDFLEDGYDPKLLQKNMDMWWDACLNPSE